MEVQNGAARIKLLAERRAGELLADMENAKTGPKPPIVSQAATQFTPTLSDIGITRDQSSRFQRIAKLTTDEIEL